MLPSFARTTVTVIRPTQRVERGSVYADFASPSEHTIERCSVQPGQVTDDANDHRDAVRSDAIVFAPAGVDVLFGDRIRVGSDVYDVVGDAERIESPTGRSDHTVIRLRRFRG